jgi:hypothetical protein
MTCEPSAALENFVSTWAIRGKALARARNPKNQTSIP